MRQRTGFLALYLRAAARQEKRLGLLALIGLGPGVAVLAAWLHPALRLGYIGAYVANLPPLRSLCWAGAITCTGILYLEGLKAVLASGG